MVREVPPAPPSHFSVTTTDSHFFLFLYIFYLKAYTVALVSEDRAYEESLPASLEI